MPDKPLFPRFREVLQAEAKAGRRDGHKAETGPLIERISAETGRKPETVRRWQGNPRPIRAKEANAIARALSAAKAERLGDSDPMAYWAGFYFDMMEPREHLSADLAPVAVACLAEVFKAGPVYGNLEVQGRILNAVIAELCRVKVELSAIAPDGELAPEIDALRALAGVETARDLEEARVAVSKIRG